MACKASLAVVMRMSECGPAILIGGVGDEHKPHVEATEA